jgi:hypothetical protein
MTERYSSVAPAEVQAALGKVVSLAGYRDLLRTAGGENKRSGGKADHDSDHRRRLTVASTSNHAREADDSGPRSKQGQVGESAQRLMAGG